MVSRIASLLSIAFAAATFAAADGAVAAAGDADPSFGGTGYIRYASAKTVPALFGGGLGQGDGSVFISGGADTEIFVRHYRPDGSLDESFGDRGTTFVPGLAGEIRNSPFTRLYQAPGGGILVERAGKVRRLSISGQYDASYAPAAMNVTGRTGAYTLMPQPDGRFVIVTGQQSPTQTAAISVRFYLQDGTLDTVRGDANGERVLYPGGEGLYTETPVSAVTDADGKILIAARWERTNNVSLVLIRLNADGDYDATFGQGGVLLIGSNLGGASSPKVSVGRDGRIGYLFGALSDPGAPAYFVVYILTPAGLQDATAPSGGRISVVIPSEHNVFLGSLGWLSGSPDLAVAGPASSMSDGASEVMLWRANLSTGVPGIPEFARSSVSVDPRSMALAGNYLWIAGGEDSYVYGRVGAAPLTGFGRGVLLPYETRVFATTVPPRIVSTFAGRYQESFSEAKLLSDGRLLVLGSYNPERQQYAAPTLTRFTADGWLDSAYGNGSGRVVIGPGDGSRTVFVPSTGDSATVLNTIGVCGFTTCVYRASLSRFTGAGIPDPNFGAGQSVEIARNVPLGTIVAPGFVDAQGAVTVVRISDAGLVQPLRFTASGVSDPTFAGAAQTLSASFSFGKAIRLDALPDGRLQAIVVGGGNQQLPLQVFRWSSSGNAEPGSPAVPTIIPAADSDSTVQVFDTLPLADGRTLVAIDEQSQRILLRLRTDGTLDPTFGSAGFARIDGVVGFNTPFAAKIALQADGRILLTYNTRLGGGTALTVARFSADGQRDSTFTADQRFDSLFSLSGNESASALLVLPDGRLLAVGQSGGFGLLLKLRGASTQATIVRASVVEFFNTRLGHYFITGGPGEIMNVDQGGAGPGWQRTGYGFGAFIPETGIPSDTSPVCRFYGTPGRGPNSHFYTVSATECAAVKLDPGWTYEGTAFQLYAPVAGQCAAGQQPILRVYNNRFAQNDSNHRYLTDPAEYTRMVNAGWLAEAVVFCGALQ